MAPRPSSTGSPSLPLTSSYWSKRCGLAAWSISSASNAVCSRQLIHTVSASPEELSREPHCAQTDGVGFDSTVWLSFMRLRLKHCKDNAALRRSRVALKRCERSRAAQFRDIAAVADARASLLSLLEDPYAQMSHRMRCECCPP